MLEEGKKKDGGYFMRVDFLAHSLSDEQLLSDLKRNVNKERKVRTSVIAYLGEMDIRKSYALLGYSSLYRFTTEELLYSESSALKRIQIARMARRMPELYYYLEEGKISLTALSRLCPYLPGPGGRELLTDSLGKSVRKVEEIIASRFPKEAIIPDEMDPISEDSIEIRFRASKAFSEKLRKAQALLRHKYPKGNYADILEDALNLLLEK